MELLVPRNYEQLTQDERRILREQYIVAQEGKCWYCEELLEGEPTVRVRNKWINKDMFPKGFLLNPIHLQHDHDTGLTEGAVHARCNAVLWQYEGR